MKVKVKGIEAVVAGLTRSGIGRAALAVGKWNPRIVELLTELNHFGCITESVPDAQKAIGMGFCFACKGIKTISFIEEDQLFYVAEIMNSKQKLTGAFVIIVMEKHEKCCFTEILYTYGIHFWIAADPGSIYEIMYDAAVYSEAYDKPVVIWYPQRFLICDAVIDYKNIIYTDNLFSAGRKERTKKQRLIQSRYNQELRCGKYAIAVSGEFSELVHRMTEKIPDISVIRLDMFYRELSLSDRYEKILIAQKGEQGSGTNLYKQADMKVELPTDFYCWEKILFHSIADFLREYELPEYFRGKAWQRNYDEMLRIKSPKT